MNTQTKILATLSMAAAAGQKIEAMKNTPELKGAGTALKEIGFESSRAYPAAGVEKNVDRIADAVIRLLDGPLDPRDMLSMLIAGLTDIHAKVRHERKALIDPVIYAAQACLDFYPDDDVDHEAAFERYLEWVK
jgi:hypothetical protein